MSIKLVTQSENAIELNCNFNGNIDLKAPIQQQTGGAVKYDTQQTLTDAQKLQARENIGAMDKYNGLKKVDLCCPSIFDTTGKTQKFTVYFESGNISQYDDDADEEIQAGFKNIWMFFSSTGTFSVGKWTSFKKNIEQIVKIFSAGLMSFENSRLILYGSPLKTTTKLEIRNYSPNLNFYLTFPDGSIANYSYNTENNLFAEGISYSMHSPLERSTDASNDKGYTSQFEMQKAPTADMEVATKKYVDEKVNSASGSGSDIKSIALTTRTIPNKTAADYKEALTYLWGNGDAHSVDLSQCIITIDGVMVNYVYVRNPYIYFYVPVSANFEYDSLRGLNKYYYFCNYIEAMAATSDYKYIKRTDYAATLLTSDNYSQYISAGGGATYTEDIGDSNLYNAKEVYVHILASNGRTTSVNIRVPQNYILGEKANDYYYFPESENSNGYLWYDGSSFNISGSNYIDYIYYN